MSISFHGWMNARRDLVILLWVITLFWGLAVPTPVLGQGVGGPGLTVPGYQGVLLDFSASWCGPCQALSPIVDKLEREELPIRKIDVDAQRAIAEQFQVRVMPTLILVVNGREVQRVTGGQSESTLRQMLARIPRVQTVANGPRNDRRTSPPQFPGTATQPPNSVAQTPPATPNRDKRTAPQFPFFKNKRAESTPAKNAPIEARANIGELKLPKWDRPTPLNASVRISVTHRPSGADLGSGTIISSTEGQTYVLTCGHLFRNFKSDSVIEVDFFIDPKDKPVTFVGKLVRHNLKADVGLISIPTETPLPAVAIATADHVLAAEQDVISFGCAGGEPPSKLAHQITRINRYTGPHNIECTGVPEQGRSGGGLFSDSGVVIGVCSAADKRDQRGIYAGLKAIHNLLDECQLSKLYRGKASPRGSQESVSLAKSSDEADQQSDSTDEPVVASKSQRRHEQALRKLADSLGDLGDDEIVFMLPRDPQRAGPPRVLILRDSQITSRTARNGSRMDDAEAEER